MHIELIYRMSMVVSVRYTLTACCRDVQYDLHLVLPGKYPLCRYSLVLIRLSGQLLHRFREYGPYHLGLTLMTAQYILTKSLQDYVTWTKYINIPLSYIYLALLVMCFLLSMGNRPQG